MKIIIKFIAFILLSNCNYYIDFWIPPEKIDLSNRKMYKSKHCSRIHQYDTRYPLCPNQKCKEQWNRDLKYYGENYGNGELNWSFHLKECRKLKDE